MRRLLIPSLAGLFIAPWGCSETHGHGDDDDATESETDDDDDATGYGDPFPEHPECPAADTEPVPFGVEETCGTHVVGTFHPTIEWSDYSLDASLVTPVVARLTDDDGDGVIDENDPPDIVHIPMFGGQVMTLSGDVDATDGSIRGVGEHGQGSGLELDCCALSVAADIDQDGAMEVVVGNALYDADGNTIWANDSPDGFVAVANFDDDVAGEIVVTSPTAEVRLQDDDGTVVWRTFLPGGFIGPALLVDVDEDAWPEIGVATMDTYHMLDHDGGSLWSMPIYDDTSGILGSSAFDFEGDGTVEILFADQTDLWVFDGATGAVKHRESQHGAMTATEYPIVADVDGDGEAEIVFVSSGGFGGPEGITVIGDADGSWQPARPIWNQHAYDITSVDDAGITQTAPTANWLIHNSFRAQDITPRTTPREDAAPIITDICTIECDRGRLRVTAHVGSSGTADLPAGVWASLYSLSGTGDTFLGAFQTEAPVAPGNTSPGHVFEIDPEQVSYGAIALVVDDPGNGQGEIEECDEDNNVIEVYDGLCPP